MATIKSHTDLPQSKKLAEILPLESADMVYCAIHNIGQEIHHCNVPIFAYASHKDIPCWSLAALLEQFGDAAGLARNYGLWFCYDNRKAYHTKHYDNPVDACYEMILKLHELNLL